VDDLIERILFLQRIERGLNQIKNGEVTLHEEVIEEVDRLIQGLHKVKKMMD